MLHLMGLKKRNRGKSQKPKNPQTPSKHKARSIWSLETIKICEEKFSRYSPLYSMKLLFLKVEVYWPLNLKQKQKNIIIDKLWENMIITLPAK